MEIGQNLAYNIIMDFKKKEVDKIERAKFVLDYCKTHKLSIRKFATTFGLNKSTVDDWVMYSRITKEDMKELKEQGIGEREIYKGLRSNKPKYDRKTHEYEKVNIKEMKFDSPTDNALKECIAKIKPFVNGKFTESKQTESLIIELRELISKIYRNLEKKRR